MFIKLFKLLAVAFAITAMPTLAQADGKPVIYVAGDQTLLSEFAIRYFAMTNGEYAEVEDGELVAMVQNEYSSALMYFHKRDDGNYMEYIHVTYSEEFVYGYESYLLLEDGKITYSLAVSSDGEIWLDVFTDQDVTRPEDLEQVVIVEDIGNWDGFPHVAMKEGEKEFYPRIAIVDEWAEIFAYPNADADLYGNFPLSEYGQMLLGLPAWLQPTHSDPVYISLTLPNPNWFDGKIAIIPVVTTVKLACSDDTCVAIYSVEQ